MSGPIPRISLGEDGYSISRLIVGGWQLSAGHRDEAIDERTLFTGLATIARSGWTTFDCADIYTGVEELFGRFRAAHAGALRGDGTELQFHTKCVPDADRLGSLRKSDVEATVDRSLARLGVERLDLVQFHWWNYRVPGYVEAAQWLNDLRQAGKIRHLGATNFDTSRIREMRDAGVPLVTQQVQYSLLDRRPEAQLVPLAREMGMGLLAYGALAGGLLGGRYLGVPAPREPFSNRSLAKYRLIVEEAGGWARLQRLLAKLDDAARLLGCSPAELAMRWVLDRPGVAAIMVGTFHARHLDSCLRSLDPALSLTAASVGELIDEALEGLDPLRGDVFDLERDLDGPHARLMKTNLSRPQA